MYHLVVGALLLQVAAPLDLCNRHGAIPAEVTQYRYRNETLMHNCNCVHQEACIRKCCAVGFVASRGVCERREGPPGLQVPLYRNKELLRNVTLEDGILAGTLQCDFFPFPGVETRDKDWMFIQEDGTLLTSVYGLIGNDRYCVDELQGQGLAAFICYNDESTSRNMNNIGMMISIPFLFVTFMVYLLLPERNLYMKALMSYVLSLMLAYIILVYIQQVEEFDPITCRVFGYLCLFLFMSSFLWMNVICFDIWFTFSGHRGVGSRKSAERRRFLIYSAWAWGLALVQTLVVLTIALTISETNRYQPAIGNGQCFLGKGYPELYYFYGPITVLITANIAMYAVTAFKIRSIKKDTEMLKKEDSKRHSYENDKQTYNLYVKLSFAMGINWSMEIISWAVGWIMSTQSSYIFYATDFCNALYGVFIFFIFVFKRSTWKLLKKRYYSVRGKTHLAHSMTQNPTRMTTCSTASTSVNNGDHTNSLLTTSTY